MSTDAKRADFYPRSPCGERRRPRRLKSRRMTFLSTLSLRRATAQVSPDTSSTQISIHALLAESDAEMAKTSNADTNFYPRSPCGERQNQPGKSHKLAGFLSTLSLRRATNTKSGQNSRAGFLSTLSLRRATKTAHRAGGSKNISIHALLAESDRSSCWKKLSRLISIHALLAESDSWTKTIAAEVGDFYPRSPCGERQRAEIHASSQQEFLSTLSLRRATLRLYWLPLITLPISIHALLAESDPKIHQ